MVGSAVFSRVDSDDSLACWTSIIDVQGVGDSRPVSLVIEPATVPESAVCELAATVMARFGEFAEVAADYLRQQLRGPQFGLRHSELVELDATESLFGEPGLPACPRHRLDDGAPVYWRTAHGLHTLGTTAAHISSEITSRDARTSAHPTAPETLQQQT